MKLSQYLIPNLTGFIFLSVSSLADGEETKSPASSLGIGFAEGYQ